MVTFDTDKVDDAVVDNDRYFAQHTISKLNQDVDKLLLHTDKCTYVDAFRFKDRFGYDLPWEYLSTGGKTVLNAYYNPNTVFDCLECGKSALIDATHLPHGRFSNGVPYSDSDNDIIDVMVDDEHYTSVREVKDAYC